MIEAGINYFIVTIPREAYDQEAVRHFAREVIPLFGVACLTASEISR